MENEEKDRSENKYSEPVNEYKKDQAGGNLGDPSAKRNIGPNGIMERKDQKDELSNLQIAGNEVTGYGGNDHVNAGESAQGPGFEAEGSEFIAHQANASVSEEEKQQIKNQVPEEPGRQKATDPETKKEQNPDSTL